MVNMENDNLFPSIVFDVAGNLFSVNSRYIEGIVQLKDYTEAPNAPKEARGHMQYRGAAVALFDLRAALNMGSLEQQYDEFCHMIDGRKEDHVRWVRALEDTAQRNAPFPLATDPHQCALGKWRDSFHCDVGEVNFQLRQLDTPHNSLHHSAVDILNLWKDGDTAANRKAIMAIYDHVKNTYMPLVLSMLDETKHVFRESIFREMVLLLNDRKNFGVIVENVHSVEHLSDICDASLISRFVDYTYITAVKRSEKIDGLILELNLSKVVDETTGFHPPEL